MIAIGLTGGFASGKTTAARMFVKLGAKFVSSDEIVHALLSVKGACRRKILRVFGREILTAGRIDRRKLGGIVFADVKSREQLERIIHPAVIKDIQGKIRAYRKSKSTRALIVEVPLLFEAGLENQFDLTMTVIATRPQQILRALKARSLTLQEINHRIKAQLPLAEKKRLADIVLDNRGSFQNTQRQVKLVWQKLARIKQLNLK